MVRDYGAAGGTVAGSRGRGGGLLAGIKRSRANTPAWRTAFSVSVAGLLRAAGGCRYCTGGQHIQRMAADVLLMGAFLPAGGGRSALAGGPPLGPIAGGAMVAPDWRRLVSGKRCFPGFRRRGDPRRQFAADNNVWRDHSSAGQRNLCFSIAASASAGLFQFAGEPGGAGRTGATV